MPSPRHAHCACLGVEVLEDRCLLSTTSYVDGLYSVFLHRSPGAPEAASFINALNSGGYPRQIITDFVISAEYESSVVAAAYESYLHRAPDAALGGWVGFEQSTLNPERLAARLMASDEYFQLHGNNNNSWLDGVFHDALGRSVDPNGLAIWSRALQTGLSRETVAYDIIKSPEALIPIITAAYQNLLNRTPDPGELPHWIVEMQDGMSSTELRAAFARSDEYIADQGGIDLIARSPIDQLSTTSSPLNTLTDPLQLVRELQNQVRLALGPAPIVFLGDSIIDWYATSSGQPIWNSLIAPLGAVDFGIRLFTTSQVLGQVNAGQVAALAPKVAVLMVGTNNLNFGASSTATAEGIASIVDAIQTSSPQTRILLLGILPQGYSPADPYRTLDAQVNAQIASLADGRRVTFLDIGGYFKLPGGIIPQSLLIDGVHPTLAGYQIMTYAIRPTLLNLLAEQGPL